MNTLQFNLRNTNPLNNCTAHHQTILAYGYIFYLHIRLCLYLACTLPKNLNSLLLLGSDLLILWATARKKDSLFVSITL